MERRRRRRRRRYDEADDDDGGGEEEMPDGGGGGGGGDCRCLLVVGVRKCGCVGEGARACTCERVCVAGADGM